MRKISVKLVTDTIVKHTTVVADNFKVATEMGICELRANGKVLLGESTNHFKTAVLVDAKGSPIGKASCYNVK